MVLSLESLLETMMYGYLLSGQMQQLKGTIKAMSGC